MVAQYENGSRKADAVRRVRHGPRFRTLPDTPAGGVRCRSGWNELFFLAYKHSSSVWSGRHNYILTEGRLAAGC